MLSTPCLLPSCSQACYPYVLYWLDDGVVVLVLLVMVHGCYVDRVLLQYEGVMAPR